MALHHAAPGEVVDLLPTDAASSGERSTAIVKTDHFETIRLVMPRGAAMRRHQVPGSITLHCLEGHVELALDDGTIALRRHQWVHLAGGAPHSVRSVEDSVLLLTILFPSPGAGEARAASPAIDAYEDCDCVDRWEADGGPVVPADRTVARRG